MRHLNSIELKEKITDYTLDIKYCEVDDLTIKMTQFINFINDQPISNRILERIKVDFFNLHETMNVNTFSRNNKFYSEILNQLTTREIQGAFGYFYITQKFSENPKHRTHYLDNIRDWYKAKDLNEYNQKFKTYFFEPFIELFEWFLRESETINPNDYFSEEARENIISRINELEEKLTLIIGSGNQIVFEEVEEVKELITFLNKKNWTEIIKGKFIDLAMENVISLQVAESIIESVTGIKPNLSK